MKINRKTKTTLLITLGCIVCFALISYQFKGESAEIAPGEQTEVEAPAKEENTGLQIKKDDLKLLKVRESDKSIKMPVTGRIVPLNTTNIFSEVQGKVLSTRFKLKEGYSFKKGETLLKLDSREFEFQLEAQRSAFLNILTGMMSDLKSDYPDNYQNWLQYIRSYKSGSNLAALPDTKTESEKYFITSNQVYSTYYNIKALEERLTKFVVIAPFSGSVTTAMADKGGLVSPGQQLGTIINNKQFELEAGAGIEVTSKINIGDQIVFTSNEIEGEWKGTVLRIGDIIDTKTQNIPIYFDIQGPNLTTGLYLEGSFISGKLKSVFTIPTAILTRDEKVLLLEDNTIKGKPVELIEFTQDSIMVRGLSNNDLLIVNKFNIPVEGMKLSM